MPKNTMCLELKKHPVQCHQHIYNAEYINALQMYSTIKMSIFIAGKAAKM